MSKWRCSVLRLHGIYKTILVRHIPDWFPGAGFKQIAKEWRATIYDMVDSRTHEHAKQQMVMLLTLHATVCNDT